MPPKFIKYHDGYALDHDDAEDTLQFLDSSHSKYLPALTACIRNPKTFFLWRDFAISAVLAIDPQLDSSVDAIVSVLCDKDGYLHGTAAQALRHCGKDKIPLVVPALVRFMKKPNVYLGAQIDAFNTLAFLLGRKGAVKAVFR